MAATLKLARWFIEQPEDDIPLVAKAGPRAQNWSHEQVPPAIRERLRSRLTNGDPVAVRIPSQLRRKQEGAIHEDLFRVVVQHDPRASDGDIRFLRDGLLISGVRCRRCPGHRAIVIVEEGPLATFLGDSENPAHTEWQKENLRENYSYHDSCLNYVVQSVPNLLAAIRDDGREKDSTVLLDLFSIPGRDEAGPKAKRPGPKPKPSQESQPTSVEVPGTKPRRYTLQQRSDGFVIRRGAPGAERPRTIDVRMAYDTRRGDPFAKYLSADFDLASRAITLRIRGMDVVEKKENSLRLAVQDEDFEVAVSGFDTNRDLILEVKCDRQPAEESDAEAD
jgi:hypothetical protein